MNPATMGHVMSTDTQTCMEVEYISYMTLQLRPSMQVGGAFRTAHSSCKTAREVIRYRQSVGSLDSSELIKNDLMEAILRSSEHLRDRHHRFRNV